MIKHKYNLLFENNFFSDVICDVGLDGTPQNNNDNEEIKGLVEKLLIC